MLGSLAKTVFVYWLPVVIYLSVLRSLSATSKLGVPEFFLADKLYHAAVFSILGFLWARALRSLFEMRPASLVAVAFWGCFLYGVIDEFVIQAATPGRFPSVWDLGADVVGALIGGSLFVWGIGWKVRFRSSRTTG